MSMVSVPAVPVITKGEVSVIVSVSVAESATGSVPAGTSMVSKELPPPPPVVRVAVPSPSSASVPLVTVISEKGV